MKVKVIKKDKPSAKISVDMKKSKKDTQKLKKPKKELMASAVKAAVNSVPAPLTFAEKKVLSVKRKTKVPKTTPGAKATSSAKPKAKKIAKAKSITEPTSKRAPEATAEATKKVQKNPSKQDKKADEKVGKKKSSAKGNKKKDKTNAPQKPRETGPVATEVSEETLALVPQQLFSAKNFKVVFEHMKKKAASEDKNRLFGDDLKYALQVTAMKIPRWPARNARVALPHSLLRKEDDVCLIVEDLKRGRKFDYQDTLNYWEDKLRELGVTGVTQIIPFQQLKRDYREFEMKLKLVHRFGRFLADARIVGHVFCFLGKIFTARCKNAIPVKMDKEKTIKNNIETALRTETYRQTNVGKQIEIKFAANWMPVDKAVANGMALMEALKEIYPGGWLNIQSLYLTTACNRQQSFPLYMSSIDPNAVPVPTKVGPREVFIEKQKAMVRESTGGKFEVTADGLLKMIYPREGAGIEEVALEK